ncbi:MAG TPA: hypothetical protein VMV51_03080 [Gemmatimonadaceae bacterium]|nr:hypothetical protein [Gemmatimonadaceae bacterium]
MRRSSRWSLAFAIVLVPLGATARAQDNPHGPKIGACSVCHRSDGWTPVAISKDFRHAPGTFPLEGAHQHAACTACHRTLDFANTPAACASCHTDVHHGEFGTQCARCHTPRSFIDPAAMRRMHELTRFPLRGAHVMAACEACHLPASPGQSQYANRPTTCFGCHAVDYQRVKAPDHVAGAYPQVCTECHTMVSWRGASFDHASTGFALTGGHAAVACTSCHGDGVYKGKSTLCVSCHQADYNKTSDPPHAAAGFPTACETCHTTANWTSATFNHSTTQFPLTGAHLAAVCSACHGDGVYKGKSTACVSCHQTDYNSTANPPHAASGFPTTCDNCHGTSSWTAPFDHSTTQFPLTGGHLAVACSACHGDGVYKGKSTLCVSCHQADFASTTNPPHASAGFPTTCETCHSTANWTSATFDHNTTQFPLTGAHVSVACTACHGDGVYKGKPTTCVSCHLANYNATSNPAHAAAGFPTTCAQCHTTATWAGATFDHDGSFFPIYSGTHKGRWSTCADCHTSPSNYAVFTCTGACHTQSNTDSHHQGVSGYRYDSNACYSCHRNGRSG